VSGLTPQVLAEITALGKTVLLIVAITFMVWALYTAMLYPKRHPDFPRDLNLYIVVTAVLFVAQMGAVVWVTGTQEVEHEATSEEHGETTPAETTGGETTGGETTGGETTGGETTAEEGGGGDAEAGAEVFASAGCGSCHTLADAGATGTVGPNLDDTKPTAELAVDRVTNGQGAMPSFSDSLDEQQIADVAAYVSSVAGA
jgi:mono/diheme cytochrome c family protein